MLDMGIKSTLIQLISPLVITIHEPYNKHTVASITSALISYCFFDVKRLETKQTWTCHLQGKKGSDSTDEGARRANGQTSSGTSLGSSSSGAGLGTGASLSASGLRSRARARARAGTRGCRRSTSAGGSGVGARGTRARARAAVVAAAATAGSLRSSALRGVEVCRDAGLDAVGVLLGLGLSTVALDALLGTLGGVNGVLVVGRRDSDAVSLAVDITLGALVQANLSG